MTIDGVKTHMVASVDIPPENQIGLCSFMCMGAGFVSFPGESGNRRGDFHGRVRPLQGDLD